MSLLKIPFALGVPWSVWVTFAIPFKNSSPNERRGYRETARERVLEFTFKWAMIVGSTLGFACGLSEALVVVAARWPGLLISHIILSWLASLDSAHSIRFTALSFTASAMAICGGFLRCWCYAHMGRLFTHNLVLRENHRLVVSGPYSYVRHPSYTGFIMVAVGAIISVWSRGSYARECGILDTSLGQCVVILWSLWLSCVIGVIARRLGGEDGALQGEFGKEWERWREAVPWRLVPWVY